MVQRLRNSLSIPISRRKVFGLVGTVGAGAWLGLACRTQPESEFEAESQPQNVLEALARLKEGNRRFVAGHSLHAHEGQGWRQRLTAGQHPFATILGCSDSRVPTELVFDQGFGDLFVVRVAGNVIATDVVGSIEYAAFHLHTPLLVVLGHEGCGAVTAALEAREKKSDEPPAIANLVRLINPALEGIDPHLPPQEQLRKGVEANVRWSLKQLRELPEAQRPLQEKQIHLVGAVYELQSGQVRWLEESPAA